MAHHTPRPGRTWSWSWVNALFSIFLNILGFLDSAADLQPKTLNGPNAGLVSCELALHGACGVLFLPLRNADYRRCYASGPGSPAPLLARPFSHSQLGRCCRGGGGGEDCRRGSVGAPRVKCVA
jgi:hypothetical protein